MEFVNDSSHATLIRRINIIDGPVMPHPSSSTGKRIRVRHASITFALKGGEWIVDGWYGLKVTGAVLKKDGTEGKDVWGGTVHYTWQKMPEYVWLARLIDAVRPEGAPQLPFRLTEIENDDTEVGS